MDTRLGEKTKVVFVQECTEIAELYISVNDRSRLFCDLLSYRNIGDRLLWMTYYIASVTLWPVYNIYVIRKLIFDSSQYRFMI